MFVRVSLNLGPIQVLIHPYGLSEIRLPESAGSDSRTAKRFHGLGKGSSRRV